MTKGAAGRIIFFVLFCSAIAVLNGCTDDSQPAPVIDAWYQKGAASDFYVVQRDDTIYSIAFAFGLDYRSLAAANHLNPPYHITKGERLRMTHTPVGQYQAESHPPMPFVHAAAASTPSYGVPLEGAPGWHWPVKGRLMHSFSRLPNGHPGLSIAGKLGESVRAASGGVVVYSGDGVRGYGNLIIIKHNDSYLSAYAFNQENLVNVGDRVVAGTVIAHMGKNDAGRTLLYFEIRHNGVPVNPLPLLR